MKILNREYDVNINPNAIVNLTFMGDITEVRYMPCVNSEIKIKKLNDKEYLYLPSGEIFEFDKTENRSESLNTIRVTLGKLRKYINTNVLDRSKIHWITLTYKQRTFRDEEVQPMRDTVKLYKDYFLFIKALRRTYDKDNIEYIAVAEPQGNGSWHMHVILIWDRKAPYIPNLVLRRKFWKQGYVHINYIKKSCDNIGAYFSAYLGDVEYHEGDEVKDGCSVKVVKDKFGREKKFIKGGRLHYYPPGMNLYRCSKGIKEPDEVKCIYEDVAKLDLGELTYKSTLNMVDIERDKTMEISYEYYNRKRKDISNIKEKLERMRK